MFNLIKSKLFSNHIGYITARVLQEDGQWNFRWNWESSIMLMKELRGLEGPFTTREEAQQARTDFIERDRAQNPNRQYNIVDE